MRNQYTVSISAPDRWPEHKHNLCGKEEDGKDREREKRWKGFPVRVCQGFPQSHLGHVCWSGLGTFLHRDFTLPLCITNTHTSSLLLSLFKFILLYFSTLFFNYLSLSFTLQPHSKWKQVAVCLHTSQWERGNTSWKQLPTTHRLCNFCTQGTRITSESMAAHGRMQSKCDPAELTSNLNLFTS